VSRYNADSEACVRWDLTTGPGTMELPFSRGKEGKPDSEVLSDADVMASFYADRPRAETRDLGNETEAALQNRRMSLQVLSHSSHASHDSQAIPLTVTKRLSHLVPSRAQPRPSLGKWRSQESARGPQRPMLSQILSVRHSDVPDVEETEQVEEELGTGAATDGGASSSSDEKLAK